MYFASDMFFSMPEATALIINEGPQREVEFIMAEASLELSILPEYSSPHRLAPEGYPLKSEDIKTYEKLPEKPKVFLVMLLSGLESRLNTPVLTKILAAIQ